MFRLSHRTLLLTLLISSLIAGLKGSPAMAIGSQDGQELKLQTANLSSTLLGDGPLGPGDAHRSKDLISRNDSLLANADISEALRSRRLALEAIDRMTAEHNRFNEQFLRAAADDEARRSREAELNKLAKERDQARVQHLTLADELLWMQAQADSEVLLDGKCRDLDAQLGKVDDRIQSLKLALTQLENERAREKLEQVKYGDVKEQIRSSMLRIGRPVQPELSERLVRLEQLLARTEDAERMHTLICAQNCKERQVHVENAKEELVVLSSKRDVLRKSLTMANKSLALAREETEVLKAMRAAAAMARDEAIKILLEATQRAINRVAATAGQAMDQVRNAESAGMQEIRSAADVAQERIKSAVERMIAQNSRITFEDEKDGPRALLHMEGANAPERYEFNIEGASALIKQTDGSVAVYDDEGNRVGVIEKPWARDSHGITVPTRLEVRESVLIQIVEHRGQRFTYPIIADPFWRNVWSKTKRIAGALFRVNWGKAGKDCVKGAIGAGGAGVSRVLILGAKFIPGEGQVVAGAGCVFNATLNLEYKKKRKK